MPSRWFIPVAGLDPARVRPEFLHAAFTSWFDRREEATRLSDEDAPAHDSAVKPYTVSFPRQDARERIGVEITTLTAWAHAQLVATAHPGVQVRLGNQIRRIEAPVLEREDSWEQLARASGASSWELSFVTPVTFMRGNRSSPLPNARSVITTLVRVWQAWSPLPIAEIDATPWVTDLDLTSSVNLVSVRDPDGRPARITISGATGTVHLRAGGEPDRVDPYLRLAAYTGIGSFTRHGFGVTRVRCLAPPAEG